MKLLDIVDYDIVNYKDPSMFLIFSVCKGFKCEKENNESCLNRSLETANKVEISAESVLQRYNNNKLTRAIVCGGLEPFDTPEDIVELILTLQNHNFSGTLVIYTGYNKGETVVDSVLYTLYKQKPCFDLIIKFGRYLKKQNHSTYCEELGINLASSNQFAMKFEKAVQNYEETN